jgi:PPOX class probable F420-dependent enzyme
MQNERLTLDSWAKTLLDEARIGHLATANKNGSPHIIPICYAFDGNAIYTSIDEKPKRATPTNLRRVKNIIANPNAALVVDLYSENWQDLRYVIVWGVAEIVHGGEEHERAIGLLRQKYSQYLEMNLEERPVIKIVPTKITAWEAAASTR